MSEISKAVLITGCSTGIGRATAEHLAANGWTVYATARKLSAIEDLEAKGCTVLELDVCDENSMREAVGTVEAKEGAVGVLVNNAGYGQEGAFEDIPMDSVRRQFETNVFGLIQMTKLVLPGMRKQRWGKVVNMSSMGGKLTLPGGAYYHATKHAVEGISESLRAEVRPFGVDVIIIEPGPINTEFGRTAIQSIENGEDSPYAAFNAGVAQVIQDAYDGPMGKITPGPEAVARVVLKAISAPKPQARYPVGAMGRTLMGLRWMLPDRGFDAFLRTQYKPPAKT